MPDFDDFFEGHGHHLTSMDIVIGVTGVAISALVVLILCHCCRGSRNRGRVLQPPPEHAGGGGGAAAVPYPQQQYAVAVPTVTAIPVGHNVSSPYPAGGAPYPGAGGAPYPMGGAPYPTGGAPYPAVAPYPAAYPAAMPQPAGPSAPEVNAFTQLAPAGWAAQALPPSYEQVMSASKHSSPYNPHAPH